MAPNDNNLAMALQLFAKAERETDPERRARLEALAESYRDTGKSMPALAVDFELPDKDENGADRR
jgi:hypothetical protein